MDADRPIKQGHGTCIQGYCLGAFAPHDLPGIKDLMIERSLPAVEVNRQASAIADKIKIFSRANILQ